MIEKPYFSNIGYISQGTVLINNDGFVFDEFISEQLKDKAVLCPDLIEIMQNKDEYKNKIVVLYRTQEREINFLKLYLKVINFRVSMDFIISKYLNFDPNFSEDQFLNLITQNSRNYLYKTILVFHRLRKKLNISASGLIGIDKNNFFEFWRSVDFSILNFDALDKYLKIIASPSIYIILDLVLYNLFEYKNKEIELILEMLDGKDVNLNDFREELDFFTSVGAIYQPEAGVFKFI